ncbi:pseudouridine synthase [Gorgonomyces haynaldii]|nr:pseudouridine synthase [Gorgonomyces haynaldii]
MFLEKSCGISCFINHRKGFRGIMKARFEDFHVHEVDLTGRKVQLEHIQPVEKQDLNVGKSLEQKLEEVESIYPNHAISDHLKQILSGEQVKFEIAVQDKETRKLLHQKTREHFDEQVGTSGTPDTIVFTNYDPKKHKRSQKLGKYLHFTLYKEDRDTMECINTISRITRIPSKQFTFAGTKDKRAITTQRVSVENGSLERLQGLNKTARNFYLGNFEYATQRLMLGDLSGNHFSIVLRQLEGAEHVQESLEAIAETGFINYYGMQRFGTRSIPTSDAGKTILAGKWQETVDLIMCLKDEDIGEYKEARELWLKNRNPEEALQKFPKGAIAERAILSSYLKHGMDNHASAIQSIPRNLRMMYVHAYQSLVWNHMASERFQLYGQKVVVGDLVLLGSDTKLDNLEEAIQDRLDNKAQVKIVTQEDLDKYSYMDVVLPLPGSSIQYPQNEMLQKYKDYMALDGFDPLEMKGNLKEYHLKGSYRKVFAKASNLNYKILKYTDDEPLIQSDLQRLNGQELESQGISYHSRRRPDCIVGRVYTLNVTVCHHVPS